MSSGDFGAELQQSVHDHIATIAKMAEDAKARIGDAVAGIAPSPAPVDGAPAPPVPGPDAAPARRYNVSFDDVPPWEEPP